MSAALQKIVILHTNDIHSHFEQMPKIATVIRSVKRQYQNGLALTVDCGDHMDRMRLETEGSSGLANIAVMNATGYDIAVLGNNEGLTFNFETLAEVYGKYAQFDVLGSNLFEASSGSIPDWLLPQVIKQVGDIRIGVIGVTANFADFYRLLGWDIQDPFEIVMNGVQTLRGQVDLVVVISHLGLTKDRRLAEEIEGIDVILGGHTHHLLEQALRIGGTYICAAGKFGQYVGEVAITFDLQERRPASVESRCILVDGYVEDESIRELIQDYRMDSQTKLSEVVAHLDEPLEIDWNSESRLGNVLASGLRTFVDAEIGIVNAGQLLQSLHAGQITKEHLLYLCPSPINPCRMQISGEQIRVALEESLLPEFMEKPITGFGFRGKLLGTLCVDGLEVSYDPNALPYQKIQQVRVNGVVMDPERTYVVGTIDMFTFGTGYLSLKQGRDIRFYLPEFLRDLLAGLLLDKSVIDQSKFKRWIAVTGD